MRGDDPAEDLTRITVSSVFPACAGMIPVFRGVQVLQTGVPRMRGDDPRRDVHTEPHDCGVPRMRGDDPVNV